MTSHSWPLLSNALYAVCVKHLRSFYRRIVKYHQSIKMGPVITRNKYKVGCSILSPQANNFQNFEKLHDESTFREASVPNRVSTLLSPRCFWSLSLLGHFLRIRQNSGEVLLERYVAHVAQADILPTNRFLLISGQFFLRTTKRALSQ